jgi:cytochrome c-type biogenesis protein CcmH/NrfG
MTAPPAARSPGVVQAAMESMSVLAAMAVMIVLIALSFLGSGFWTRLRATASAPKLEHTSGIHPMLNPQVAHYAQRETTSAFR